MDVAKEGRGHRSGASDLRQAHSRKEIHNKRKALGDGRTPGLCSIVRL